MKIVVIGCGVMGSALARHFSKKHSVILCDRGTERSVLLAKELGAEVYARQADAVEKADVAVIAVKPKDLGPVAKAIASAMTKDKLAVSVLAGVSLKTLRKHFPQGVLVRMMPNLALVCGQGIIGLVDDPELSPEAKKTIDILVEGLGLVSWQKEEKLEAFTAVAGSSPAFVFLLIEAMIESGIFLGFNAAEAREFALKTIEGAAALMRKEGVHPGELKWKIASPGGTTIAGLKALEEHAVHSALMDAYIATCRRAQEIGQEQ